MASDAMTDGSNRRASRWLRNADWAAIATGAVRIVDPLGSPAAPVTTASFIDSYGTSLMPRTSLHQGVVSGLSMLGAHATATTVENVTVRAAGKNAPLALRLAVRALIAAAGATGAALAQREGRAEASLKWASVDAAGTVIAGSAVGGMAYDATETLKARYGSTAAVAPVVSLAASAGITLWARRRLRRRKHEIERWPVEQVAAQWRSTLIGAGIVVAGVGLGRLSGLTYRSIAGYLGPGPTKRVLAAGVNAALWSGATVAAYNAGVAAVGRSNETLEPGYAEPPASRLVSGSDESYSPFEDLGKQGRRFVTDVATPTLIKEVIGSDPVEHPIRVFIGFNSEPLYPTGRAELAMEELERTGAFERSHLLLVSPTGTGWVDHTMIEAAELVTRGDIATCCIQYGRYPSFLAIQKVALGRAQFRLLLWAVRQRLLALDPADRPKVLVFGESLGAWASSDVVMYQGIEGFDHYGIDRALWIGLPGLAKWSRNGMARGASDLVPEGTVGVFDTPEQLAALSDEERQRLRATILSHDNDPIAVLATELMVQQPGWLSDGETRGRGVPDSMRFSPFITFWHTVADAMNAMVTVPGEFRSFGHDYRADIARVVIDAYDLPKPTGEQLERIEEMLRSLETDRAERLAAAGGEITKPDAADDGTDSVGASPAGEPVTETRTGGARWRRPPSRSLR